MGIVGALKVGGRVAAVVGVPVGIVTGLTRLDRSNSEIDMWADRYMGAYDRDGKAGISLRAPTSKEPGAIMDDERVRGATSLDAEAGTILPLLVAANKRHLDGDRNSVSRSELRAEIASFDRNGDGDVETEMREFFGDRHTTEEGRFRTRFQLQQWSRYGGWEGSIRYRDVIENYGPDQEVRHRFDKAKPR